MTPEDRRVSAVRQRLSWLGWLDFDDPFWKQNKPFLSVLQLLLNYSIFCGSLFMASLFSATSDFERFRLDGLQKMLCPTWNLDLWGPINDNHSNVRKWDSHRFNSMKSKVVISGPEGIRKGYEYFKEIYFEMLIHNWWTYNISLCFMIPDEMHWTISTQKLSLWSQLVMVKSTISGCIKKKTSKNSF